MIKTDELLARKARIRAGGGAARIAAQHNAGKLTARERLELLFDPHTFVAGIKRRRRATGLLPDTAALKAAWSMPTLRILLYWGDLWGRFTPKKYAGCRTKR